MEDVPVFLGLDYHSKSVQVCVMDGQGRELVNRKCGNSVVEIRAAVPLAQEGNRCHPPRCA